MFQICQQNGLMYYTNSEQGQAYFKEASKQTTNSCFGQSDPIEDLPVPLAAPRRTTPHRGRGGAAAVGGGGTGAGGGGDPGPRRAAAPVHPQAGVRGEAGGAGSKRRAGGVLLERIRVGGDSRIALTRVALARIALTRVALTRIAHPNPPDARGANRRRECHTGASSIYFSAGAGFLVCKYFKGGPGPVDQVFSGRDYAGLRRAGGSTVGRSTDVPWGAAKELGVVKLIHGRARRSKSYHGTIRETRM